MNARELRIGNLVYYLDGNGNFYQWDITVIENGITDDFEPIPLTEEWLNKFGFKYIDDHEEIYEFDAEYLQSGFQIRKSGNGQSGFVAINIDFTLVIEYVHQLQNLYFAMTGEELTIR